MAYNKEGIHDVSNDHLDIMCPQMTLGGKSRGQEDCLFLNVYSPEPALNGTSLPVLIWIHGGGLTSGSGRMAEYGPQYFMDTEQVVVVTINYRLGKGSRNRFIYM